MKSYYSLTNLVKISHTNLKAASGELISRCTAAGDGAGEDIGPTLELKGFLGVTGRSGDGDDAWCIVKELSMAHSIFFALKHLRDSCNTPVDVHT